MGELDSEKLYWLTAAGNSWKVRLKINGPLTNWQIHLTARRIISLALLKQYKIIYENDALHNSSVTILKPIQNPHTVYCAIRVQTKGSFITIGSLDTSINVQHTQTKTTRHPTLQGCVQLVNQGSSFGSLAICRTRKLKITTTREQSEMHAFLNQLCLNIWPQTHLPRRDVAWQIGQGNWGHSLGTQGSSGLRITPKNPPHPQSSAGPSESMVISAQRQATGLL